MLWTELWTPVYSHSSSLRSPLFFVAVLAFHRPCVLHPFAWVRLELMSMQNHLCAVQLRPLRGFMWRLCWCLWSAAEVKGLQWTKALARNAPALKINDKTWQQKSNHKKQKRDHKVKLAKQTSLVSEFWDFEWCLESLFIFCDPGTPSRSRRRAGVSTSPQFPPQNPAVMSSSGNYSSGPEPSFSTAKQELFLCALYYIYLFLAVEKVGKTVLQNFPENHRTSLFPASLQLSFIVVCIFNRQKGTINI